MEKLIQHMPLMLLIGLIVRCLAFGAQLPEAICVVAVSGLIYLLANTNYNKRSIEIQQQMDAIVKEQEKQRQDFTDTKAYVSGVKMANALGPRKSG